MGRSKASLSITLEHTITRAQVINFLHSHASMIDLNPLVIRHERGDPPPADKIPVEESTEMLWYDVTDRIQYLPRIAAASTEVTYKAGLQDLPDGLKSHIFAPGGVELRGRWTVVEAGSGDVNGDVQSEAKGGTEGTLVLKEDVEMDCFFLLTAFVKKNLEKAHAVIAEKLAAAHTHQ